MSMDDFEYIRVDYSKSFIKVWNKTSQAVATKLVIPTQRKLQVFLYWYHVQRNWRLIPTTSNFDVATMRLLVKKIYSENSGKGFYLMDLYPGNIEIDLKW